GAVVAMHGSRPATVAAAIERLRVRAPGARLVAAPGDFRSAEAIDAVVAAAVAETGRLDAVIHCAITGAEGVTGLFKETTPQNYGALAQNVLAVFERLCFAALPHLAQNGGAIIAFAADAGRFASARQSLLGGVYGGLMAFVRNLA